MLRKIDHLVLTTNQPATLLTFYEKLGFSIREGNGRHELFAGDFKLNVHLLGQELSPHAAQVQPGSADLCFEWAGSLVSFAAKLTAAGIAPELGPVSRTGVGGIMESLYLRDPDGNLLEFCSYS